MSSNAEALKELPRLIDEFLQAKLALRLNPSKTSLQALDRGVDHLGYWIKPDHTLVRQKNVKVCHEKLAATAVLSPQKMQATLNSYLGMFRMVASKRLRATLGKKLAHTRRYAARLKMDPQHKRVVVIPDKQQEAEEAAEERAMVEEFKRHFGPDHPGRYLREWKSLGPILRDASEFFA